MEQTTLTGPTLIMPDLNAKSFTANGTEYFISSSLSIERLAIREKMELKFGFGSSFTQVFDALKDAYGLLNDRKFADAAVKLYNTMQGVANADENEISAVELCTLFINAAGEDITVYDAAVMEKKKEDWKKGGIDAKFFFQLAALTTSGFISAFKAVTQSSLLPGNQE
jgi:hypothetical protein